MASSLLRDLAAEIVPLSALGSTTATAGGAGDATAANGITIDLLAYAKAEAVGFIITAQAALTNTKKLTMAAKIQDSADGTAWADVSVPVSYSGQSTASTVTLATATQTYQQVSVVSVPLEYCRRYVRVVATPDLDNTATDTATFMAAGLLFGINRRTAA